MYPIPSQFQQVMRTFSAAGSLALILDFAFLTGLCSTSSVAQEITPQAATPTPADKPVAVEKAITEDEANEFSDRLYQAIVSGNIDDCNRLIDWDGIVAKGTLKPESTKLKAIRESFSKTVVAQLKGDGSFCSRISADIKNGGSYKCLRVNVDSEKPFVTFRLQLANDNGLNYHRLFLKRTSKGDIQAGDVYIFLSAECLSEIMQRTWTHVAQGQLRTPFQAIFSPPDPFAAGLKSFAKFSTLVATNESAAALALYRKLPAIIQRDKNALLLRMKAAQAVSDQEYADAIDDFQKYHPNDLAIDFLLIDGYTGRMKYEQAIECLDRANKNLGGDAMLFLTRAELLLLLHRVPEARKSVEEAILMEPDLQDAYATGLGVSLADLNFEETVKYLTVLENQFGQKWKDLREVPQFEEFVKSVEYLNWAETQKN